MLAEIIGGLISDSLALLADAGHMFGDFVALTLAWAAFRVGSKSPDLRHSFGYHRFQVLAAFVNGIALLAIAAWILTTAIIRLIYPQNVLSAPMLVIGSLGLIVNLVVLRILTAAEQTNLNLRGAILHVMGDLLGSLTAIGAALIIMFSGWMQADPLLSIIVAILIIHSGFVVVRQAGHILLEGTPEEVDPAQVNSQLMAQIPEILDIHHVHTLVTYGQPSSSHSACTDCNTRRTRSYNEGDSLRLRITLQCVTCNSAVRIRPVHGR